MRSAQKQASQNVTSAQGAANTAGKNAAGIFGTLTPFLTSQMTNPQGLGDPTVNAMKTQATQAAGGGEAAAQGLLALNAARSRNNAGFSEAADKSARDAEANAIDARTGIDIQNQKLKTQQQQEAERQLGGLFGTNIGAETGNINAANEGVNAEVNAGKRGWLQNTMGIINSLKPGFSKGGFSVG